MQATIRIISRIIYSAS